MICAWFFSTDARVVKGNSRRMNVCKLTGSLNPCSIWDFSILATRIIMVREKHPAENPSHPFLGHNMPHQLWLLITDIVPIQMSLWQMSIYTILISGFLDGGWWFCTRYKLLSSSTESQNRFCSVFLVKLIPVHHAYDWDITAVSYTPIPKPGL